MRFSSQMSLSLGIIWIILANIPDVENSLAELSCDQTVYNNMLQSIPSDSGSNQSKCRIAIEELVKLTPNDFVNETAVEDHFANVCNESSCLTYAGRIVDRCLTKLKPVLGLACASNGAYMCWTVPSRYNASTAQELCYKETRDGNCTEACKNELSRVSSSQNCCVSNAYNSTLFGTQLSETVLGNDTVWELCEVERQGFCPVPDAISNVTYPTETESSQSGFKLLSITLLWPSPILISCKDFL